MILGIWFRLGSLRFNSQFVIVSEVTLSILATRGWLNFKSRRFFLRWSP